MLSQVEEEEEEEDEDDGEGKRTCSVFLQHVAWRFRNNRNIAESEKEEAKEGQNEDMNGKEEEGLCGFKPAACCMALEMLTGKKRTSNKYTRS